MKSRTGTGRQPDQLLGAGRGKAEEFMARIAGRVMRSVFIGWELRDEDADEADRQDRRRAPKPVTPITQGDGDGLKRHIEFMSKLFTADP